MPQPHRRERAFDRVRRPQMQPMLGREVVERQQHVPILLQAIRRAGVLRTEHLAERVERRFGRRPRRRHPDRVQHLLCLALHALVHLVQHIGGLVHPTSMAMWQSATPTRILLLWLRCRLLPSRVAVRRGLPQTLSLMRIAANSSSDRCENGVSGATAISSGSCLIPTASAYWSAAFA
jgi:hypothetical protein